MDSISYFGCSGDGFGIEYKGIMYDESNPIDTIITYSPARCDSIMIINLQFEVPPKVEAGSLCNALCSNSPLSLSELMPEITGGVSTCKWANSGDGLFDNNGDFGGSNPATVYIPGAVDIANEKFILSLTSDDPPGTCEPAADAVLIIINNIECSHFPWSGNN